MNFFVLPDTSSVCPKADPSSLGHLPPHDWAVSHFMRCRPVAPHTLGLSPLTSLFMYPSLLMSYKLNVHLSFSWTVPLSRIDRAVTKSWEVEEA